MNLIDRPIDVAESKKGSGDFRSLPYWGRDSAAKPISPRDVENPRDLSRLGNPQLALEDLDGLIVIDEIQRLPELFPPIKYADAPKMTRSLNIARNKRFDALVKSRLRIFRTQYIVF